MMMSTEDVECELDHSGEEETLLPLTHDERRERKQETLRTHLITRADKAEASFPTRPENSLVESGFGRKLKKQRKSKSKSSPSWTGPMVVMEILLTFHTR